jgi:hypothetical protein
MNHLTHANPLGLFLLGSAVGTLLSLVLLQA